MARKKASSAAANAPRRSPRLANLPADAPADHELPKKKRPAKKPKKSPKKLKKSPKETKPEPVPNPVQEEEAQEEAEGSKKTIIVEHCKQCNSFKTRALHVKKGLEEGVEGVEVVLNPEKPRKGCFEIREENGEKFLTLLNMKRPFSAMKALSMDQVVADIVEKIK